MATDDGAGGRPDARPGTGSGQEAVDMNLRTRRVTAALALLVVLGATAGCRTGEPDPGSEPTQEATTPAPDPDEPTDEPTQEPSAEPGAAVNGPNSITAPVAGAQVTGPTVTVSGEGTAFEATLNYRVVVAGTQDVVAEGYTMAGANGEVGPYSFDVELAPGEYTVQVWEPDVSDGESGVDEHNPVEVTFTVG